MRIVLISACFGIPLIAPLLHPSAQAEPPEPPFESPDFHTPASAIDDAVLSALMPLGIPPAHNSSDEVFLRRVYLDTLGRLPEPKETTAFLIDSKPGKRARLIDDLLQRPACASTLALRWCDMLRVKSEFPINLWPNAAQAYHQWIKDQLAADTPWDQIARLLLTSGGSNFRVPAVNFYRAAEDRQPQTLARMAALTFMGQRTSSWPKEKLDGFALFFSRLRYKTTGEWKEEVVLNDVSASSPLQGTLPDGSRVTVPAGKDPRNAVADWLLKPGNDAFADAMANRVWSWLFGRGIVHEPDDFRPDNPPSNPALLAALRAEFIRGGYSGRSLLRAILNSRTYQQSCLPRSDHPGAGNLFAFYPPRRLDAEVLADVLSQISYEGQGYTSMIPEPFTQIPENYRAVDLPDGSISSSFLELFGRPPRDTGFASERSNEPTPNQLLHLMNSSHILKDVIRGPRLRTTLQTTRDNPAKGVSELYLLLLCRKPTDAETSAITAHLGAATATKNSNSGRNAAEDVVWALLNSKEFLFQH